MKKCPTCDKTFDDNLKFCQKDGTPLVSAEEKPAEDPYKTTVAKADELPIPPEEPKKEDSKEEVDPFKTMVAGSSLSDLEKEVESETPKEESKEEIDPMKTMVVSGNTSDDIKIDVPKDEPDDAPPPPSPFDVNDSPVPKPPKFEEPAESAPLPPIDKKEDSAKPDIPSEKPKSEKSKPIPSPFDKSMPPGYNTPSVPPFDPTEPVKAEKVASAKPASFDEPIGSTENQGDFSSPAASAPMEEFGGNEIEQNTTPGDEGLNQTLAYVSLASGILSCLCCLSIITGPAGFITGFMARSKANNEPDVYGGQQFALIGMITGVIGTLLGIALFIWVIITNLL